MNDLTKGNISKNLLMFAIPSMISGVVTRALATIDTIMLGQILGEIGLAATGSTSSFITVISAVFWGLTAGFGIHMAFLLSCKSYQRAKRALFSHIITILTLTLICSGLVLALQRPIFSLLKISGEIYDFSRQYYVIYFLGLPLYMFNNLGNQFFLATGNSRLPMRIAFCSGFGNVILNYLFIVIFRLGVAGAATATVLVSLLTAIYRALMIARELKHLECEQRVAFRPDFAEIKKIWLLGLPCMIQQFVMYLSSATIQPSINALGPTSIAAYSVCLSFYDIVATMFQSSSLGMSTYAAQCVGKRKPELISRGFLVSVRQGLLFSLPFIALLLIFPDAIGSLFLKNPSSETTALIIEYVYTCIPFIVLVVFNNLFHNFFRGMQKPVFTMLTTIIYSFTRICTTFALIPHLAMTGVFYGFVLAWGVEFTVCMILYLSKKWKSQELLAIEKERRAREAT